jgi:hypothetical protein
VAAGDSLGATGFPVPEPTDGSVAGDPALGYVLAFLKSAVNSACGDMWEVICPGRTETCSPILFTFARDPQKLFEDNRLPALYAWRGKSNRSRYGDDLYRRTSEIKLAWVNEPGQEDHLVTRDPAMNAIANAIDVALTGDRDPSWTIKGDSDPLAQLRGSSLSGACGFSRCQPTNDAPQELMFQRIEEAAPLPYYGFAMTVEVDEYQDKYGSWARYPARLNATQSTNGMPSVAIQQDVP